MKTLIVKFIVNDEDMDHLDHDLRQSQLLNDWPVLVWAWNDSTQAEIEIYEQEYATDEEIERSFDASR